MQRRQAATGPRAGGPRAGGPRAGGPRARGPRDRGAVAVEFALVLPLLLLLIFGIIDFGRALNAQITLTQAAREGARLEALGQSNVVTRTQAAATGLSPVTVTIVDSCPTGAGPGADAVVQTSYSYSFITPVGAFASMFGGSLPSTLTLTARSEMPCET
jgi:TadE-like protein